VTLARRWQTKVDPAKIRWPLTEGLSPNPSVSTLPSTFNLFGSIPAVRCVRAIPGSSQSPSFLHAFGRSTIFTALEGLEGRNQAKLTGHPRYKHSGGADIGGIPPRFRYPRACYGRGSLATPLPALLFLTGPSASPAHLKPSSPCSDVPASVSLTRPESQP
jgi:hypothetical protein